MSPNKGLASDARSASMNLTYVLVSEFGDVAKCGARRRALHRNELALNLTIGMINPPDTYGRLEPNIGKADSNPVPMSLN